MWHFVIEPVISYYKCIDVMGLNKTDKKTVAIARFWMGYKIYLASLGPILMAASVVRGIT